MDATTSPLGHAPLEQRKVTGAHYTPEPLARFVANKIVEAISNIRPDAPLAALDPACGDGQLIDELIQVLHARGSRRLSIVGFDTDKAAIEAATRRLRHAFPDVALDIRLGDFLEFATSSRPGDMFAPHAPQKFDLVIANPPYVRTQLIESSNVTAMAKRFGLTGRFDLYYPFLLATAEVLRPGGVAGVICSNRFMTTKAGQSLRRQLLERFDIMHIWDLGDTRLFEAAVLPAVLLLRGRGDLPSKHPTLFTSIYSSTPSDAATEFPDTIEAISAHGPVRVGNSNFFNVRHGRLAYDDGPSSAWRIADEVSEPWLAKVGAHTFATFAAIGKVRVGVKTTADRVFISNRWDEMPPEERPELLRPLITHHVARKYKALQLDKSYSLLYPHHTVQGTRSPVDLSLYPRSAIYLEKHRQTLEARDYLTQSGRKWFEVWVPQDPDAWQYPKLVFRDISLEPTCWLDLSGAVVNGDCYWLSVPGEDSPLVWLALAVANSPFITNFYDHRFHNLLYAKRRRFMTQYVEAFPLPNPASRTGTRIISLSRQLFGAPVSADNSALQAEVDGLVGEAFGLGVEEVTR